MALVDLFAVSKQYDNKKLLENVDFHLHVGERVAIIGQNGSGKSTLMKIVLGALEADEGRRVADQSIEIEMLAQVPKFADGLSVREAIENELADLKTAKKRYEKLSEQLADDYDNAALQKEYETVAAFLDHHNAWNLDNKVEQVLQQFNLVDFAGNPVNQLSGGEQRRVALASLILKKPDVLILDEPTNHLDVHMVEYLEEFISKENFTILFVSHDRYFIDNIATQIVEVENFALRKYQGGYADFLEQKANLLDIMERQQHNLEKHLSQEESWLGRGVKARQKRNVGRKKRVLELREEVKSNPSLIRKMKKELLREQTAFASSKKSSSKKIFFDIYNVSYSIGKRQLIDKFRTKILQKDRIAVVGPNGSGKSTLLKLLTQQIQPSSGNIKQGDFSVAYFDQQREMLDDSKDLISVFCPDGGDRVMVQGKNMHVFGYLKTFNFPPEDLNKKISMLSGGERSRVALALLFTRPADCLILDEPTNDLDIQTINILEEKLAQFNGVIIFVSHDRYFVDKVAEKLFIFKSGGKIEESYQKYSDYLELEKTLGELDSLEAEQATLASKPAETNQKKSQKLSYKDQLDYDQLPDKISALEIEIDELNNLIQQSSDNLETLNKNIQLLEEKQQLLDDSETRYLELLEQVEAFAQ